MAAVEPGIRLDKWLWYARFFKTRSLATAQCQAGRVRIDGAVVTKPHAAVRPNQVLTIVQAQQVRVVRVVGLGARRGPASEAQTLYEDLSPPSPETRLPRDPSGHHPASSGPTRVPGSGRPTKRDRRTLDAWRQDH